MEAIFENLFNLQWQQLIMWFVGALLIYLAIRHDMEPTLLLPMGFGAILVNLPMSGAVTQVVNGVREIGAIDVLFESGIANELFPLLLFIGIGAMIDFAPLLSNPKMLFLVPLPNLEFSLPFPWLRSSALNCTMQLPSVSSARLMVRPPSLWPTF